MRTKILDIIFFCFLFIIVGCSKNKEAVISKKENIIKDNIAGEIIESKEIEIEQEKKEDFIWKQQDGKFYNTAIQENIELKKKELEELVDTIHFIDNAVPGKPCTEPEKRGWSIHHAKDVRENFSDIPVYPTEKTQDDIYLLGKTENFTLYGKGNHENLLLESNGCYSEIFYPYTSNYMHLPELYELDIDQDGVLELGIKLHLQKGTELSIHNLLLADFNEENELYVYQYQEEDFTEDLQRVIDFDDVERGIYLLLNGEKTGIYTEDKYENEPFTSIGVGAIMHFLYDDIKEGIWLTGILLFERKGSVMYETNGSAVKALVGWNGKEFFLSQYQVVLDGEK